ncbi:MAG: methionyl-tRNA formyltransferase [Candidatus Gastranaerophilales bacterium]|nr:methionyl-tRNA formyltransferase [Candidatus Gastranaerophilales bacterium]
MDNLRVVFLATPKIACNTLSEFHKKDDIDVLCVITQPDKPAGRGRKLTPPPIKLVAQENNIDVYQPSSIRKDVNLIEKLKNMAPDFFITFAFGQILSQEVLDIPKIGTINLHASLLPKYRGPNPIAKAIANGDTETGVSTMLTSLGVDEGDVVLSEKITISNDMTTQDLAEKISEIAPEILYKTLVGLKNKTLKPIPQNHAEATFAPKFTKEESFLNFNKSAIELHNWVRALYPRANAYYNGSLVKIVQTEVINEISNKQAGEIIKRDKNGLYVATGNGVLLIKTVKPEGKNEMPSSAWACGLKSLDKFN